MSRPDFNDMDWQSVLDSEIFRNYMKSELQKEAYEKAEKASPEYLEKQAQQKLDIYNQLEDFRSKVKSSPRLHEYFKQCKKILASNPELVKKVDPNFIAGINLLKLAMDDSDISLAKDDENALESIADDFKAFLSDKYQTDPLSLTKNMLDALLGDFCASKNISDDVKEKILKIL